MIPPFNSSARSRFERNGYFVLEGLFDPEVDFGPVIEEYQARLDELAGLLREQGILRSAYADLPFPQRLIAITRESGKLHSQFLDISLPQKNVRQETPIHLGKEVFNLLRHPKLLDAVEFFLGPEIYSNPVQHVRFKLPKYAVPEGHWDGLATTIYWHQDQGVILPEADESEILTVWFPITDALIENGCLQVVPGSHRRGLQSHCPSTTKGVHIPENSLPGEALPLPMRCGSVLFMHRRTIHSSLENTSDQLRWSFDLRYNVIGAPTGRPSFPGFVARSRAHPEWVLNDFKRWAELWLDARTRIARRENPVYNRWSTGAPPCA